MSSHETNPVGVIWGAAEIGRAIGKTTRQAFHLLETGQLQGAKKIGGRWAITHRALRANFEAADTAVREAEPLSPHEHEQALAHRE
jgi:hypothetical protein